MAYCIGAVPEQWAWHLLNEAGTRVGKKQRQDTTSNGAYASLDRCSGKKRERLELSRVQPIAGLGALVSCIIVGQT